MTNAIECRGLTKFYGKSMAIENVNLTVEEEEVFGFIGPNGAGKSTTLRVLLSFIYPTSGTAAIFGKDCVSESRVVKQDIGYIPSEVSYYDDMTVRDLLRYSARFYRLDCTQRAHELSDRLGLDMTKKIKALSLGNRKKVAIVQAFQHEPRLYVFDEPTSGLDPLVQQEFFTLLEEEKDKGNTVLFSSHVLSEVQQVCDRVAIIKNGHILRVESVEALRKSSLKRVRVTFRTPQTAFDVEGAKEVQLDGRAATFLYSGDLNRLLSVLRADTVDDLEILEPPLEEVFLHYYEGERAS